MPRMNTGTVEQGSETEFHVSRVIIVYKLVLGLFELISGIGIIVWSGKAYQLYLSFITTEFSEDPHDVVAHLLERVIPNLFYHHTYLAVTLVLLGAAKLAGAIGLINRKNWGVDLLVGLTILMLPFQLVNLLLHPAILDLIYFLVGLLIALYLINFKPKAWVSKMAFQAKNRLEGLKS